MKLLFFEGTANGNGAKTIFDSFTFDYICGHCDNNCKIIMVVKQRNMWFTLLIIIHECLHYINNKVFSGGKRKSNNKWIDKHIKRKKDKLR